MTTTIYFFLKFFKEEQYAREFVAGRLHLNPLAYFKGLERHASDGRADSHEAPFAWHPPASLGAIEFAGHRIEPSELAGPLIVQYADADLMNVLCLYAATSGPFEKVSAANLDGLREHLRVPDICQNLGPIAVLITPPRTFIERFDEAVRRSGFGLERSLVTYFDPDSFSGSVEHPVFMKKNEYAWQREYRFAIDRGAAGAEPYTLDIGSLGDLCTIVETAKVIEEQFQVMLPE